MKVQPGASHNRITGREEGVWQIKIAAPPVKGRANQELVSFLSRVLQTGKSAVSVVKGHTGRYKTVTIDGPNEEEVIRLLTSKLSSSSGEARRI